MPAPKQSRIVCTIEFLIFSLDFVKAAGSRPAMRDPSPSDTIDTIFAAEASMAKPVHCQSSIVVVVGLGCCVVSQTIMYDVLVELLAQHTMWMVYGTFSRP